MHQTVTPWEFQFRIFEEKKTLKLVVLTWQNEKRQSFFCMPLYLTNVRNERCALVVQENCLTLKKVRCSVSWFIHPVSFCVCLCSRSKKPLDKLGLRNFLWSRSLLQFPSVYTFASTLIALKYIFFPAQHKLTKGTGFLFFLSYTITIVSCGTSANPSANLIPILSCVVSAIKPLDTRNIPKLPFSFSIVMQNGITVWWADISAPHCFFTPLPDAVFLVVILFCFYWVVIQTFLEVVWCLKISVIVVSIL